MTKTEHSIYSSIKNKDEYSTQWAKILALATKVDAIPKTFAQCGAKWSK